MNISSLITGSSLDVEHALMLLLLLVGLLSIEGRQRRFVPWVILVGIVIALVTPIHTIEPAWPILTAILVPILMWHVSLRIATVRSMWSWKQGLSWLIIAMLLGAALSASGSQDIGSTILLSVVAASLVLQVQERPSDGIYLSAFGLLTVALLLAEVDLTLHSIGTWLGTLFSGVGFGLALGVIAVIVAKRFIPPKTRNWFFLIVAYVAYLLGVLLGISGIALTLMTGLVVAVYGLHTGMWPGEDSLPSPLNRIWTFWVLAGAWMLLGWQAHVPLSTTRVAGIGFSLVAVGIGVLTARWLAPPNQDETRSPWKRLWLKERKVLLLVGGKLLLWSPDITLEPLIVAVALAGSIVVFGLLRFALYPFFQLIGVELNDEVGTSPDPRTIM